MENLVSNYLVTGLTTMGGACALIKGYRDLDEKSNTNKTLAKAEVIAGCVALAFSALNLLFSLSNISIDKRFLILDEKDIANLNQKLLEPSLKGIDVIAIGVVAGLIGGSWASLLGTRTVMRLRERFL